MTRCLCDACDKVEGSGFCCVCGDRWGSMRHPSPATPRLGLIARTAIAIGVGAAVGVVVATVVADTIEAFREQFGEGEAVER